ncbi:copper-binding protein [Ideonella livida]|uniref:RND transporter n=1 Tax=Ideonella livida TaxID=2707176 RepID=A0A7C9TIQ5_9BURK|nr:copper-binding protein [Ideonella livida]NDY89667.1 RND transporter [Ideonella livida]
MPTSAERRHPPTSALLLAAACLGMGAFPAHAAEPASDEGDGEVRRLDPGAGRITIRHGGLVHLDVPPMALTFRVSPPSLMQGLNVGDLVEFRVEKVEGTFVITRLQKSRH